MIMRQLEQMLVLLVVMNLSKIQLCSQRYNFIRNDFLGYHSTRRIQRNHDIHLRTFRRQRRHMKDARHNPSHQSDVFDGKGTLIQNIKTV